MKRSVTGSRCGNGQIGAKMEQLADNLNMGVMGSYVQRGETAKGLGIDIA